MWQIPAAHEIHLWHTSLKVDSQQERESFQLLSEDEVSRALRFHFPEHKRRYIAARGVLRLILSHYLNLPAQQIEFTYSHRGKPAVKADHNPHHLQFNVSHSDDLALYGMTKTYAVGVDIEKVRNGYENGVAERFFSPQEYSAFSQLPQQEKLKKFYQIWAKKEAILKAVGEGLFTPLHSFSVSLDATCETVLLPFQGTDMLWHLENVEVDAEFKSAFATNQTIEKIELRQF